MIAIETRHRIKELSEADAGEFIGEIAAAAGTTMSIVTADQVEQAAVLRRSQ